MLSKTRSLPFALFCAVASCIVTVSALGFGGSNGTVCPQQVGPDIICGDIQSTANYAAEQVNGEWFDAFSFGQYQCNVGNANVSYVAFPSNQHPGFAPSLYRLKDNRIEQIGIGWVFHGFTALSDNICGCGCNGAGGSVLGVGCSSPNTASNAGERGSLGPRWQVNAFTGFFPTGGPANPPYSGTTARRVRVKSSDLAPSTPSVKFFAEYQYVSNQDASFGNQYNNSSYRQLTITGGPNEFAASSSFPAMTVREQPAIRAWRASDPTVVETNVQLPNEGLFILAAKATQVSSALWNYEYALMNMNSDLSGQAFRVPLPAGSVVTNVGFHDVDYHSGDSMDNFTDGSLNFSGQDWQVTITSNSIQWASETYKQNINANALRWGTMYNFRFTVNRAPAGIGPTGAITLNTYKEPGAVAASTIVPGPSPCPADIGPLDQPDGNVNVTDLLALINLWGPCTPGNYAGDISGDGDVSIADLLGIINAWGACP